MKRLKAAILCSALALSAGPTFSQAVYVSPDAARPRFGGEFGLTEVGPVAGYWRSECYNWHVRSQARRAGPAPAPELDAAFRRFVSGLIAERPDYDDMSPAMAQSVRKNLVTYWPSINRMGHASSARKFDTTQDGDVLYVIDQTGGQTHWNLTVNPDGKISSAFLCMGTGL